MRLLFVIDSYPPSDRGGYAQLCYDLAHEVRGHGHDVMVLCGGPTLPQAETEQVVRLLTTPVRWEDRWPVPVQQMLLAAHRSRNNLRNFDQMFERFRPQAVLFWPSGYVDVRLMERSESLEGIVTAYYVAGVSPTDPTILEQYWANPGYSARARVVKRLFRPVLGRDRRFDIPLQLHHVMCVSDYERRRVIAAGVPAENTIVVHNGISLTQFPFLGPPSSRRKVGDPLRVLYAGRLVEDKGPHTLVDAATVLRQDDPLASIEITLLGTGPAGYVQHIDSTISDRGLAGTVTRREWVARSDMPAFLADHDVLVLPTIRPEALSRAVQEAMAMGLVVVATPTGGTPEIVADGETGLVFAPGDATDLTRCLAALAEDLPLCDRLAARGREVVIRSFTIGGMAEAVSGHFAGWLNMAARTWRDRQGDLL